MFVKEAKQTLLVTGCSGVRKAGAALCAMALVSGTLLGGCTPQEVEKAPSSAEVMVTEQNTESSNEGVTLPDTATGEAPSTPEELQMASSAAEALNVPYNGTVICTIGEPFYSDELGMTVRSISFYENGKLCAGVDCAEDGTPVANFVYY